MSAAAEPAVTGSSTLSVGREGRRNGDDGDEVKITTVDSAWAGSYVPAGRKSRGERDVAPADRGEGPCAVVDEVGQSGRFPVAAPLCEMSG